jgi:hypothetical protein
MIVGGLLCVEAGHRFARYRLKHSPEEKESPVGGMVGALLGLLAFMLAFTFGLASTRFEARRQILLSEANAIGTCYLRAAMLPEPMSTETRKLLREYVDVRLDAVHSGKLDQAIQRSEELHNQLWSQAVAVTEKERSGITSLYVASLNQVIDLHATRVQAVMRSRVPGIIWMALYLLAIIAMFMIGYQTGLANSKRSVAVIAMILGFSSVLFLIADLDRPGQGILRVSQEAMVDLRNSMK